jgi:hypothetical protein
MHSLLSLFYHHGKPMCHRSTCYRTLQYYLLLTIIYYRTVLMYDTANLFFRSNVASANHLGILFPQLPYGINV